MSRGMDFRMKPVFWRLQAEMTRSLAESMASVPEARDRLLRIAEEYEQIAQCLERQLRELLDVGGTSNVTPMTRHKDG